jgi:membrane associated rhomboid family serine protease
MSITLIIIVITGLVSWWAFSQEAVFDQYCFSPERVWHQREWVRLLSGGFLHANMPHLFFNMLSLFFFGPTVEYFFRVEFGAMGSILYVIFYLAAIVIANIPDLLEQKENYYYRAVGASGAVSAIIYSAVLFSPMSTIAFMFIPMPAFVFGILFLVFSAYMARRQMDNIGHLAHFSGAVFGFLFPLLFKPALFMDCIHQIIGRS